jgi:hypothetical protein
LPVAIAHYHAGRQGAGKRFLRDFSSFPYRVLMNPEAVNSILGDEAVAASGWLEIALYRTGDLP